MSVETEYTAKDVAAHRGAEDAWMVINGEGEQHQGKFNRDSQLTMNKQCTISQNIWKSTLVARKSW